MFNTFRFNQKSLHYADQGTVPNAYFPVPTDWLQLLFTTPNTLLFERGTGKTQPQAYLFLHPVTTLELRRGDNIATFFQQLHYWQQQGYYLAGFFAYEAAYLFEPVLPSPPEGLLAWFGVYHEPRKWVSEQPEAFLKEENPLTQSPVSDIQFQLSAEEYQQRILQIQELIGQGEIYQMNFTAPFHFKLNISPRELYKLLRSQQPTPYQAVLHLKDRLIFSFSPELFFSTDGQKIIVRPMKGTHPRGRFLEEDHLFMQVLQNDLKNQAENLMIVDLLRNDLSRVCVPGSVQVTHPLIIEQYPTVLQMTTQIEGQLSAHTRWEAIFRALFPCGSVTGAPKIRAMQLIHQLEPHPRGVYTGAIGYIFPEGQAQFSVAIRTLEIQGDKGKMGSGSGIVWDSQAMMEYQECKLKARFLTHRQPAFQLLETMRGEKGEIFFLADHLNRLATSAQYFQVPFHLTALQKALQQLQLNLSPDSLYRIRLLLNRYGQWQISAQPVVSLTFSGTHIARASHRVNSQDIFLYHKTTHRPLFDPYFQVAQKKGLADVIFLNERDEITQGCISNIFVVMQGNWYTPPISCGLLNGVFRQHLLKTRPIIEQPLHWEDLLQAEAIYIGNALRGLHKVHLVPELVTL